MAKKTRARAERRRAARAASARSEDRAIEPSSSTIVASKPPREARKTRKTRPKAQSRRRKSLPLATIGWSAAGIAVVALLVLALTASGTARQADAATEQLARTNAGTDVTVYSGRSHVVYHSEPPLPTVSNPRADGQPTLVWFSAVWCPICEQMAPFAHQTASSYTDRMVFIEKSIDEDRNSSNRYGVRGTPTFIMLDAAGSEVMRFHGQASAASFAAAIEQALAAVGESATS